MPAHEQANRYDLLARRQRRSHYIGKEASTRWESGPDLSMMADAGIINESNLTGTMQAEYVLFGGKRIARRDVPTGYKHYYFSNHLGSASVIASDIGVIPEESDYYPYGGEIAITNGDPNTYRFTGKEQDSESGLDNFVARYEASSLGRFMSPDPDQDSGFEHMEDPQAWNGYSYADNNPLRYTDPDGRAYRVCAAQASPDARTLVLTCAQISNPTFEKEALAAQANGEIFANGLMYHYDDKGNLILDGTYQWLGPDQKMANGAAIPLGEEYLGDYALGAGAGRVLGAARGAIAGWLGRSAGEGAGEAVGDAAGSLGLRAGGEVDRVFQTSAGPVRVYCQVSAEGETAVVKDLAIYPANSAGPINPGFAQVRQGLRVIQSELKEAGFTKIRVENAYRTGGANPGRTTTFTITLR